MKKSPVRTVALSLFLLILTFLAPHDAPGAEKASFEATPEGKAAVTLIAAYDAIFRIDPAYQKLTTPEQKMEFILANVEGKVQSQIIDQTKSAMLAATKAFAEKQFRLGLLQEKAPLLVGKILIEDKSLSEMWPGVKADVDAQLGARMKVMDGAIKSADIGWSTYQAWNSGGAEAGLRALGGSVADEVMGALVPGWGTFRVAQGAVVALGEYVMAYAFDTALAGKVHTLFPDIQGNPQGFGEWVIDKSPSAIRAKIDADWELVDYSGMWAGTGTDSGEEKMKQAIADQIIAMRSSLMAKHRKERLAQQEVMNLVENAELERKKAESGVRSLTEEAAVKSAEQLAVFNRFRGTVLSHKKEEADQQANAAAQLSEAIATSQTQRDFQPIKMEAALKHLEIALREYDESPSKGYDQQLIDFEENTFKEEYRRAIYEAAAANGETGSLIDLPDGRLYFSDGGTTYTKAQLKLFDARISSMRLEAETRTDRALTQARNQMQSLSDRVKAFNAESRRMAKSLEEAIGAQLSAANIYFSRPGDKEFTGLAYANLLGSDAGTYLSAVSDLKEKGYFYDAKPGFYLKAYQDLQIAEKKARQAALLAGSLLGQEKAFLAERGAAARSIMDGFKEIFSDKIRPADNLLVSRLGAEQIAGSYWCGHIASFHCFESGDAAVTLFLTGRFDGLKSEPLFMAPSILDHLVTLNRSYVGQNYNKVYEAMRDASSTLRWHANMDELAMAIIDRTALATRGLQDFTYTGDEQGESSRALRAFMQKNGAWLSSTADIGASDGQRTYEALQKAWKANGDRIISLKKLVSAYGKGIYYREGGPAAGADTLKGYQRFEEMLKIWESAKMRAHSELELFSRQVALQRGSFNDRIKAAGDESSIARRLDKFRSLQKELAAALDLADAGANRVMVVLKDELPILLSEVQTLITEGEEDWKDLEKQLIAEGGAGAARDLETLEQLAPEEEEARGMLHDRLQIQTFYLKFSEAYEARNDSGLMACLHDDWSAGDGTTLADLQGYFRNMFSVFDQIQLKMSNLVIEKNGADAGYRVSYDLSIVGSIFSDDLRHEEKSSVMEIVEIDDAGRVRIARTPQGQFWYKN